MTTASMLSRGPSRSRAVCANGNRRADDEERHRHECIHARIVRSPSHRGPTDASVERSCWVTRSDRLSLRNGREKAAEVEASVFDFSVTPWELIARAVVIYVVLLLALRLFGKRQVGQFTLYDLVFILLVANAVQPSITGPDTSLAGGVVIIVTLTLLNLAVGRLEPLRIFHRLLVSEPAVVIKDGEYLEAAMRREGVDRELCETAIREHGVASVAEVQLGVLEPDGTISIVPTDSHTIRTRRRVRFQRHG